MSYSDVAVLIITQETYFQELKLTINRLNELKMNKFFKCYVACKNLNESKFKFENWKNLEINKDCENWGSELIDTIKNIREEYLFIFLDDFYPYKYFSASKLKKTILECLSYKPSLIRINSNYNRRIFLKRKKINIFEESYKHRYATSLVFPIFRKQFLKEILLKDDSIWQFERFSNKRFNFKEHKFYFIKGHNIDLSVVNLIVKGQALRTSINKLPKNKKKIYLNNRKLKTMPLVMEFKFHLKKLFSDVFARYLPYFHEF